MKRIRRIAAVMLCISMLAASLTQAVHADAVTGGQERQLTEENAFSTAWEDIERAAYAVYKYVYWLASAGDRVPELPVFRLSLEPDALSLLELLSGSLLKTDLSWINEIGIDLIPSMQTESYSYYTGNPYEPASEGKMPLPGVNAVLHVNETEIAEAEVFLDLRSRTVTTAFPDIVSGGMTADLSSVFSSLEYLPFFRNMRYIGNPSMLISSGLQAFSEADRLLPEPELMYMIQETVGQISEKYEADKVEERVLEAGAVEERCTYYTGSIRAEDLVSILEKLTDRIDNDVIFRTAVIRWLNRIYDLYDSNAFVKQLAFSLPREVRGLINSSTELPYYASLLTGDWEFTEKRSDEDDSGYAASSDVESAPDDSLTADDFRLESGRKYSFSDITYNDYRMLREGVMSGLVRQTVRYSLGDSLWLLYQDERDTLKEGISSLYDLIDDNLIIQITNCFDKQQKLKGIIVVPVQDERELMNLQLGWPEGGRGAGFLADVSVSGEKLFRLRAENLADALRASIRVSDVLEAAAEISVNRTAGTGSLTISADGSDIEPFLVEAAMEPGGFGSVYTGRMLYDDETIASLDGSTDTVSGDVDFTLSIPQYDDVEQCYTLKGRYDAGTGNGSVKAGSARYKNGLYYSAPQTLCLIETDHLLLSPEGALTGKVSLSQTLQSGVTSVIPNGLKLTLDFDDQAVKITDNSGTYVSLKRIESGIIDSDTAAERIRSTYNEGVLWRTGSNWNIAIILNRLMKAGMPADLLKDFPLTAEEIGALIEDFSYEIGNFF